MQSARSERWSGTAEERLAWYALLALPLVVPLAVGIVPFSQPDQYPEAANPFIYPKLAPLAVLVAVAACAWTIGVLRDRIRLRTTPGLGILGLFTGLSVLSTVFAMSRSVALFGGKYQRVGLLALFLCVGVFALSTQLLNSASRIRALAWSTLPAGVIAAVIILMQSRGVDPLGLATDDRLMLLRGPSLLGNPDFTATYLVLPMTLAAALVLSETTATTRGVAGACLGLMLVGLTTSLTRGAWLGGAVAIGALIVATLRSPATRRRAMVLLVVLLLLVGIAAAVRGPTTLLGRFADFTSASSAGSQRLVLWNEAVRVIAQRPLLGTGPDSYLLGWYSARSRTSMTLRGVGTVIDDPHNLYLLLLATLGIPAGMLGALLLAAPLLAQAKSALSPDVVAKRSLYAGWWAAVLGLAVAMIFCVNNVVLDLMLAIGMAAVVAPRSRVVADRVPSGIRVGLVAATSLALVMMAVYMLSLIADVKVRAAEVIGDVASAEAAARVAPWHAEAQYQVALRTADQAVAEVSAGSASAPQAIVSASDTINSLIRTNPYDYAAYVLRANLFAQVGATNGAEAFAECRTAGSAALHLCPVSPEAAYFKALGEADLGQLDAALSTLEPVWEIDPAYSPSGVLYAQVLKSQGKTAQTREILAVLESRFPSDVNVQNLTSSFVNPAAQP